MKQPLDQAFSAALPDGRQLTLSESDGLNDLLALAWERARQAWPDFEVPAVDFAAHLATIVPAADPVAESLAEARLEDLYLAKACVLGIPEALAAFEGEYMPVLRKVARKFASAAVGADDGVQRVMKKLLTGPKPRLGTYSGRGSLRSWLRTVATREMVDAVRAEHRIDEAAAEDLRASMGAMGAMGAMGDGAADIDRLLRRKDATSLKRTFETALATLSAKERNLLRMALLEGRSIDDIAERYRVHRATAARRLNAAKEALSKAIHSQAASELGLSPGDTDSLARYAGSQLDLSLSRVLGAELEGEGDGA